MNDSSRINDSIELVRHNWSNSILVSVFFLDVFLSSNGNDSESTWCHSSSIEDFDKLKMAGKKVAKMFFHIFTESTYRSPMFEFTEGFSGCMKLFFARKIISRVVFLQYPRLCENNILKNTIETNQ